MLFAPQELFPKSNQPTWFDSLKTYRRFKKIPTPPPGIDSTEPALKRFFQEPAMLQRVVAVSVPYEGKAGKFGFGEPGFIFIKGLLGDYKSIEALQQFAQQMQGNVKKVSGHGDVQVWQADSLKIFDKTKFQNDLITQDKMPKTYQFLVKKLGEEVLPKQTFFDSKFELPPNAVMVGSSK